MIATSHQEPGKLFRLGMFVFLALPGAWLVGTCGPLMVTMTANQPDGWFCGLLGLLLMLGAALLLYGTRTNDEPLFLLVFVPMPILISLGYHLGYLGHDAGFLIGVAGMIMPALTYPPISRYYKRRATRIGNARRVAAPAAASPGNTSTPLTPTARRTRLPAAMNAAEQSNVYHTTLVSGVLRAGEISRSGLLRLPRIPYL